MRILGKRVLVSKVVEEKTEGFQAVEVQDSFVCKGQVVLTGEGCSLYETFALKPGRVVLFAKYSPDTHEVDVNGQKMKIISADDILAVYE